MKDLILYIHGKNGSSNEAEHYKFLCESYEVIGLEYYGFTPQDTKKEFLAAYENYLSRNYESISIIANSIGAFFAMNAFQNKKILQAFFISPIVDMEELILKMMTFSGISESELEHEREITTASGETLSWEYLRYVREHKIIWRVPTKILYGEKDNLTSLETIKNFAAKTSSELTIMKNGEHWFHTDEQMNFLDDWLISRIKKPEA